MRNICGIILIMMTVLSTACSARYMKGAPPGWAQETSPDYLADRVRLLDRDGERNWVLHLFEASTAALRRGDGDTAKRALDEAILQINVIYGDSEQARQARSAWRSEGRKIFKGDPYERSMVFFYRGVLYMQDRDWDNARACFRAGLFQDSIAEEQNYEADWAVFHWLIGVCEIQLRDFSSADDAFEFANEKFGASQTGVFLPEFTRDNNLLVITQQGKGPRKAGAGEFGELLTYRPGTGGDRTPEISDGKGSFVRPLVTDSVTFQAQTRGGRPLDSILRGQAKFKDAGEDIAEAGAVTGAAILLSGGDQKSEGQVIAAGALIAASAVSWGVSSFVRPAADTRAWKTLPDTIAIYTESVDNRLVDLSIRYPNKSEIYYDDLTLPPKGDGVTVLLEFEPWS